MTQLETYRTEIDALDEQLVALLEARLNIALKVAQYKQENNVPVLHQNREKEVIEKMENNLDNKAFGPHMADIFTQIMTTSKAVQKERIHGA